MVAATTAAMEKPSIGMRAANNDGLTVAAHPSEKLGRYHSTHRYHVGEPCNKAMMVQDV